MSDHQSLRTLHSQTIQTPEQQHWLTKLLGYDFEIVYKPGKENGLADALSRLPPSATLYAMTAISKPVLAFWEALRQFLKLHPPSLAMTRDILNCPDPHSHYSVKDGLLLYKGCVFVPLDSALQPLLIAEFHNSPSGGHAGVQRTFACISSSFYWPGLRCSVQDFIAWCTPCQSSKAFNRAPQGLLQPLPIPGKIWDAIAMDFITHLPPSNGKRTIIVVIDRLSKYAHFLPLVSQFTSPQVAAVFIRDVARLHEIPSSIVFDHDPIFMSHFWKEFFKLHGNVFMTSSAYHLQIDGQSEVLNRCLEDYLRCFVSDQPQQWLSYLPWAE